MESVFIFGHKNPDTDTICSSLAYSMYLNDLEKNTIACRLGNLNNETKYVFDYLNLEQPMLLEKVEDDQDVILIDHNEFSQSVDNIENANILGVIDHHRVDNFHTQKPLMMRLEPLGCSATIIYKMMLENNYQPNKVIATLLCSAIISDSLLFKSPTCCELDKQVCLELAKIANIDVNEYGLNMLKAGTDLSMFSADEIISIDSKTFDTKDGKVNVSQINTVSIDDVLENEAALIQALEKRIKEEGLNQCILMITDILEAGSMCLVIGDQDKFNEKFNVVVDNNKVYLEGVLSRKKQIVPFL